MTSADIRRAACEPGISAGRDKINSAKRTLMDLQVIRLTIW